jgi:WhiB family transcriptional regulator, redox-sensing transcriptional regulator
MAMTTISPDALTTKRSETSSSSPADVRTWAHRAACIGKNNLFFGGPAERPEARTVRELKASLICATCPVITPCRAWAREHGEYGYWGGESEEARVAAGFRTRMPRAARRPRRLNPARIA